jgi:myo-inositol-1(or 4)-monophosphatase
MHPMLNTAVKAARKAGSIISRASTDIDRLTVRRKQKNDFVTEVDHAAEEAIIRTLKEAYPSHAFLAEESGASSTGAEPEHLWIIDPLDGTTNFLHGFPQYCVSIALQHKGVLQQAVVYDPNRNELFTATRGAGAFLNDRRLRVTAVDKLEDALIGTGFPFREFAHFDDYLRMFGEVTRRCAGVRRPGAAALDLAWVACGRIDGFWEMGLSPWDMAAGALLVREAGGLIGDFSGAEGFLESGRVVAANPKVFSQLLQAIAAR